ncbi:MAG: hypothetical protein ABI591_14655 [Kofleriaceae bacterium]
MRIAALLVLSLSACLMPPQNGGNYAGSPSSPSSSGGSPSSASDPSGPPPPSSEASSSTTSAPAPQGPVSVTIRSACSKTVKVFFGDKPKFGSGTYSSIDSNSVSSHSFRPGEQLWIVDESENGLGSAQVSASTHELEVSSSCTAISSR